MLHINFYTWLLPLVFISSMIGVQKDNNDVLFCYGKVKPSQIKNYNYVILESAQFSSVDIKLIKKTNKNVLAYVSIGEINKTSKYFKDLKNLTLGKNKNWDSYFLDIKSEKTKKVLIGAVQESINKGFDGMFLDNIDNYSKFGPQKDDDKQVVQFLKLLSEKFKNTIFIQNSGIDFLPQVSNYIDGVVVESVASDYSFSTKKYGLRTETDFNARIKTINDAAAKYKTKFILVEYADTKLLFDKIAVRLSKFNFNFFVGKIDLQTIPNYTSKK
ncbi:endo alpha-1,4 polygalactosaminidase [Flavobacterium sp.]